MSRKANSNHKLHYIAEIKKKHAHTDKYQHPRDLFHNSRRYNRKNKTLNHHFTPNKAEIRPRRNRTCGAAKRPGWYSDCCWRRACCINAWCCCCFNLWFSIFSIGIQAKILPERNDRRNFSSVRVCRGRKKKKRGRKKNKIKKKKKEKKRKKKRKWQKKNERVASQKKGGIYWHG